MIKILFILLVSLLPTNVLCQIKVKVLFDSLLNSEKVFESKDELDAFIKATSTQLLDQGFYFNNVDTIISDTTATIYFTRGTRFKAVITKDQRLKSFSDFYSSSLKKLSNSGYPFASISLQPLEIKEDYLLADIVINEGPEITYDTLELASKIKTRKSYLWSLLNVVPGQLYAERSFTTIEKKLSRSEFLEMKDIPQVAFKKNKSIIYLHLQERPANSFSGILGLQQSSNQNTVLVGNIDLDLKNLFRSGKELDFHWERFGEASQLLEISYYHPFILGSRISPGLDFNLSKQDTTFITNSLSISFATFLASTLSISFDFSNLSSNLLTTDIEIIVDENLIDLKKRSYGATLSTGNSDMVRLSNQIEWHSSLYFSDRQVKRNASLPDEYYDSIQQSSVFFSFLGEVAMQKRMGNISAVYTQLSIAHMANDQLFNNELFRLGGLQSLRGFNEKQFFLSSYLVNQLEYRLFFEEESFLFLFYDQLVYEDDHPFGVGLGFSLKTNNGQFRFALASGKSNTQDMNFSNAKIHFGFQTRF